MFSERLKEARAAAGLSQAKLARLVGIAQQTVAQYETGRITPTPATIIDLSAALNVSVAWLMESETDDYTLAERELIKKYRALNAHGKKIIDTLIDLETDHKEIPKKVIPLFGNSFAAGTGQPDLGLLPESYEVSADVKADFAIKISGDSMSPYLPDGSIQLCLHRQPHDGEVAALLVDGEFLVKQIVTDIYNNLYLFSLNRDRADADRIYWAKDDHNVTCFGTVLMKRVPLPRS